MTFIRRVTNKIILSINKPIKKEQNMKRFGSIFLLAFLLSFTFNYGQVIDRAITQSTDDAEESSVDGTISLGSVDMDLGTMRVGLRYNNITIPQGATITNAYLQFTANKNGSGNVSLRVRGNDVDNAVTFSSVNGDVFTNRARTTANVIWTPGNWSIGNSGQAQRTPDISSVVQEVIDRGGWQSGNSLALLITSTIGYDGNERSGDAFSGNPAQLHVEYTQVETIERTITQSTDDAEESSVDGTISLGSVDMDLGTMRVGLRYNNITIPQGATITNAYLQFTANKNGSGNVSLRVRGNDVDNAVTFSSVNGDVFTNRARTTANVIWTPGNWSIGNSGQAQRTPDISSVVQEVIDRGGWQSGNSLALLITSTIGYDGNERSGDAFSGNPAQLHIEYENGTTPQFTLSTNTNGDGSITLSPTGGTYDDGTVVTVTANPDNGQQFDGWSGDLNGTTNPTTITMSSNRSITATFSIETTTITSLLASGSDDAEEHADGFVEIPSPDMDLATKIVGLRFGNITIPQGATITNAFIQFTADENETGNVSMRIRGNDVNNATTFTSVNSNISNRVATTASVDWSPGNWTIGNSGTAQRTPDLSSIVQEIVNRGGWTGSHIAFMITSNNGYGGNERAADSHEEGVGAEFHVEYTQGVTTSSGIVSGGDLSLEFENIGNGVELSSIQRNGTELLNTSATENLFTLDVSGSTIGSLGGWNNVNFVNNGGTSLTITLSNPINTPTFPSTLTVTITITMVSGESRWDMSVAGLNNRSLIDAKFPRMNILANGNDHFLVPRASGQVFDNPRNGNIDSDLIYPRGSGATMQFSAYYNDNYGIYFGTHDPSAALKSIRTDARNGGIMYYNGYPAPDKTVNGNDWQMPGYFSLELFDGNWYEASQLYKNWASAEADYWPELTPERETRQAEIGKVGIWAYTNHDDGNNMQTVENYALNFQNYVGVPMGFHWIGWSQDVEGDENFPHYLPPKNDAQQIVSNMIAHDIYPLPYTNGRLWDTTLPDYQANEAFATDDVDNGIQQFNDPDGIERDFAVMCPTQSAWQNTLIDVQHQITNPGANSISANAGYLDQVCHARPRQCMDASHGHPLGGGSYWREGYKEMLVGMHNVTPANVFYTAEGGCDYLNDEMDGLYVIAWKSNGMVPAYTAVYSGRVQIFGNKFGTDSWYDTPRFYSLFAQAFNYGFQPGGVTLGLPSNLNTPERTTSMEYLRELATLRFKLREFMSFGTMLKPLLDVSGRPTITTNWSVRYVNMITISALQQSIWKNKDDDKVLITFANASTTATLNNVTIDIQGSTYGLAGNLSVQRIREGNNDNAVTEPNHFVRTISLAPEEVYCIVLESTLAKKTSEEETKLVYKLDQNYPNPFNPTTVINFTIPNAGNTKVEVFNILGQKVMTLLNENLEVGSHKVEFNASNLTSGIYFYKLQSNNFTSIKKMMLIK